MVIYTYTIYTYTYAILDAHNIMVMYTGTYVTRIYHGNVYYILILFLSLSFSVSVSPTLSHSLSLYRKCVRGEGIALFRIYKTVPPLSDQPFSP